MTILRNNLTPFLEAVTKALSFELEVENPKMEQKKAVFEEILQKLPSENSASNFFTNLSQTSNTLQLEFDQLLNLR